MTQCRLSIQNGSLRLETPQQDRQTQDASAREWMKSHLDHISLESFQTSPQLQPHHRSHGNFGRIPKKIRSQYRLASQDGLVAISDPQNQNGFRVLSPEYDDGAFILYPEILATCRQINREGTRILYAENVFRREFLWRRTWTRSGRKPIPRSESSPLREANLQCIQRVRIFRTYKQWFRDGKLRALQDLPALRELQVHIDANDIWGDLDPDLHWKDAMRFISRDRPDLNCVKTQIRLCFDRRYRDWCDRCMSKPLDFSVHRIKKDELEQWIRGESLFASRALVWSFSTQVSEFCGPSCVVALTIDSSRKGVADTIECRIEEEDDNTYSTEPAYLDSKE
ncbi:hypothetical protein N0V84_006831 [Fusarium piperis]|uniref:Uncharacterized protein n=1 Tax=Fusarium piperis TaxID=1435070 RepID=A0A9W9BNZ7_9HYPO|nr:hypothetical protein N0V84_006831 [Fusarium piperis]